MPSKTIKLINLIQNLKSRKIIIAAKGNCSPWTRYKKTKFTTLKLKSTPKLNIFNYETSVIDFQYWEY